MTRTARPTLLSLWGIRINTRSSVIPTPFLISIKHLRDNELVCCCLVKDFFNHLMRCARNSVCQVNYFLRSSRITFLNLRPVHKSTLRYIVQLQLFSQRMKHYSEIDRKSTRLNSSHVAISYAVFCLKKKKNNEAYL